jgi:hypothetical protein
MISEGEKAVFSLLTSTLGVEDNFSPNESIRFSWYNKRQGGVRIMARLDRVYSFQAVALSPSPIVEYEIRGDSVHSDHLAV